jgi:hypothetical protein
MYSVPHPHADNAYKPDLVTVDGIGIPMQSNGQPGHYCAGWAAARARQLT